MARIFVKALQWLLGSLACAAATLAAAGQPTQVVTIRDNETAVGFASTALSVSENYGTFTVQVTRTGDYGAASVYVSASAGPSAQTSDYSVTPVTLSWADGDGSPKSLYVSIVNDSGAEPAEAFTLTLSSPSNTAIDPSRTSMTITIYQNDGYGGGPGNDECPPPNGNLCP